MKKAKYIVDIDGTICSQTTNGEYEKAQPYQMRIDILNNVLKEGHEVHYWTARGMSTGKNYEELTIKQLSDWGVEYTSLKFNKPSYDLWIDDKCMSDREFFGLMEISGYATSNRS